MAARKLRELVAGGSSPLPSTTHPWVIHYFSSYRSRQAAGGAAAAETGEIFGGYAVIVTMQVSEQVKAKQEAELAAKIAIVNAQAEDCGEIDGFKITVEQCAKINAGDREAVDKFFQENGLRLRRLARVFLFRIGLPPKWDRKNSRYEPGIIELGDCLNQLYVDMRQGLLKFVLKKGVLASVICHSFRYCGVGGFGDEDGIYIGRRVENALREAKI